MSNQTPRMHDWKSVIRDVESHKLESPAILETIAFLARNESWRELWGVADLLSREVSVLFDDDDKVWVDIGTSGMVRPKPPIGSILPLKLWIHTHPYNAYWSSTDLDTLAVYSPVLNEALVLGHDHFKRATRNDGSHPPLAETGPLSNWTSEEIIHYPLEDSNVG